MAVEMEDFPIKHGDFPVRYLSHYQSVKTFQKTWFYFRIYRCLGPWDPKPGCLTLGCTPTIFYRKSTFGWVNHAQMTIFPFEFSQQKTIHLDEKNNGFLMISLTHICSTPNFPHESGPLWAQNDHLHLSPRCCGVQVRWYRHLGDAIEQLKSWEKV